MNEFAVRRIGVVHSSLTERKGGPRQGYEGAPDAQIDIEPEFVPALLGIREGDDIIVLTWLHAGRRDVLEVYPRGDRANPLTGVFATRSPDRPNPIGLHRVRVRRVEAVRRLHVGPLEVIDGTPVIDIKAVLARSDDA